MTLRYAIENQRSVHIHADMQREQCVVENGPREERRLYLSLLSHTWSCQRLTGSCSFFRNLVWVWWHWGALNKRPRVFHSSRESNDVSVSGSDGKETAVSLTHILLNRECPVDFVDENCVRSCSSQSLKEETSEYPSL